MIKSSYAEVVKKQSISVPLIKENFFRLYTILQVGKNAPKVHAIVDTGSPWLVIKEQYVSNYKKTNKIIKTGYGYANNVKKIEGQLVFADVTLNTKPQVIAKNVPIIMISNNSFKGISAILGLKITTQNSLLNHLPKPYNEVVILDAPKNKMIFSQSLPSLIKQYTTYQLKVRKCRNITAPTVLKKNIKCWESGQIPVTYTFIDNKGDIITTSTLGTLFDSGGIDTQFALHTIPDELKNHITNHYLDGSIKSAVLYNTNYHIPVTEHVRVTQSRLNHINSGHKLFYQRSVLFDTVLGVVGLK